MKDDGAPTLRPTDSGAAGGSGGLSVARALHLGALLLCGGNPPCPRAELGSPQQHGAEAAVLRLHGASSDGTVATSCWTSWVLGGAGRTWGIGRFAREMTWSRWTWLASQPLLLQVLGRCVRLLQLISELVDHMSILTHW